MTHAELDQIFVCHQPKGFGAEINPLTTAKIRRGFETDTPLRPRGDRIPKPEGPKGSASGLEAQFDDEGAASDGFDRNHQAEADYSAVCENMTGKILPEEAFEKVRERRAVQDGQTEELAQSLGCRGEAFHYGPNWAGRVSVIGVFSGAVLPLPPVRRVAFLPSIALANRSKMLRDIEYFLHCHPVGCRMFTITNGQRVRFETPEQFRKAQGDFCRRISRLQTEAPFRRYLVPRKRRKRAGKGGYRQIVSIEWRAVEYGTPEFDLGFLSLHLHAHLLVRELVPMTGKQRAKFRKKLWRALGRDEDGKSVARHWDDAGQIQNPREFVKYPVKPGDLETICREGGPGLLRDFYEAVRGMHIVQPMGALRAERSARRAAGRRIWTIDGPDGRQLIEGYDPNAGKRPFSERNKRREEYQKRCLWNTLRAVSVARSRIFPWVDLESEKAAEETARNDEGNGRPDSPIADRIGPQIANRIIARLSPAPYGSPICEPGVAVWGFDGNHLAVFRQPAVARLRDAHRAAWVRACDARALALACSRTGAGARAASEGSQRSNNCRQAIPADPPRTAGEAWSRTEWTELLALN